MGEKCYEKFDKMIKNDKNRIEEQQEVNYTKLENDTNFWNRYKYSENQKVKSLTIDKTKVDFDLYNDIQKICTNIDEDKSLENYNEKVINYIKNDSIETLMISKYDMSKEEFEKNYNDYFSNKNDLETSKEIENKDIRELEFWEKFSITQENPHEIKEEFKEIKGNRFIMFEKVNDLIEKEESLQNFNEEVNYKDNSEGLFEFKRNVEERLEKADKDCKELYIGLKECIKIGDKKYTGTSYYDQQEQRIYFNEDADCFDKRGIGTTYFHEVGHLLDDLAGNGKTNLSDDEKFKEALKIDFEDMIKEIEERNECKRKEALEILSIDLLSVEKHAVSDIVSGLSNNQCEGLWVHRKEYWELPKKLEREAFANFFESSCSDVEKMEILQKYFPKSHKVFKKLVKEGIWWK